MPRRIVIAVCLCIAVFLSGGCDSNTGDNPAALVETTGVQNRGSNTNYWWNELPRPEWAAYERVATSQDWFEVYKVADDIFAIYEPGQYEEVISFLLVGSERSLLFDTGLGIGNMRAVIDELTDDEVFVVNSHTHYDHVGGNYQFDQIYARDLDYTKGSAAGTGHDEMAEWVSDGWTWKPLPKGFDRDAYVSHPFTVTHVINEGDRIDIGGRTLEVLLTPGHAPDSICLLDRENRLLLTGDTFYLAPLYTHIEGSNFDDYARSAARLAGLAGEIDIAMTSHNVPVVDGRYMTKLGQAFESIKSGSAQFEVTDGNREYFFENFSVIVKGP